MDDTNFVDDVGDDLYIDAMDEADEAAQGDGDNALSNEAYGDMVVEESSEKDRIDDAAYNKYIGAEAMMYVLGEVPRRASVRLCIEELDGEKMGTYHRNPLMYT